MHSSLKKWLPAELEQVENKSAPAKAFKFKKMAPSRIPYRKTRGSPLTR